jgi:hypothetical protein
MNNLAYLVTCLSFSLTITLKAQTPADYRAYHRQMIEADKYLIEGDYTRALFIMDDVFARYDFVFLRDFQIAAQVDTYIGNRPRLFAI